MYSESDLLEKQLDIDIARVLGEEANVEDHNADKRPAGFEQQLSEHTMVTITKTRDNSRFQYTDQSDVKSDDQSAVFYLNFRLNQVKN